MKEFPFLFRKQISPAAIAMILGCASAALAQNATTAPAGQPAPAATATSRSPLPQEALVQAREAEKLLAANQPAKAIEALRALDKQYPGHAAISLRLGEIYDTQDDAGYALFYYRRYLNLVEGAPREHAVARVTTLEITAGAPLEAEAAARALGEPTSPRPTPAPRIEKILAGATEDGTLIPIHNEEELKNIGKLAQEASRRAASVTPSVTPIVIPDSLLAETQKKVQQAAAQGEAGSASAGTGAPRSTRPSADQSASTVPAMPRRTPPPDEDALLAQAFLSTDTTAETTDDGSDTDADADSAENATTEALGATATLSPIGSLEQELALSSAADSDTGARTAPAPRPADIAPMSEIAAPPSLSAGQSSANRPRTAPAPSGSVSSLPSALPSHASAPVAYTSQTPAVDTPRAASFFYISRGSGANAQVSLVNSIAKSVATVSIIPFDDQQAISAILVSGESKSLTVPPGHYRVTVKVATTDYSPITLMSTTFEYRFDRGQKYTRRFDNESVQKLN